MLYNTVFKIIWRPSIASVAPNTLSWWHPMDPSCSAPLPAASLTATLDTILVEIAFLMRLSSVKFDLSNSEMHIFTQLARSADPYFYIRH